MFSLVLLRSLIGRRGRCLPTLLLLALCLSGCAEANVSSTALSDHASLNAPPHTIYVADFSLKGSDIRARGVLSRVNHPVLIGRLLPYSPLLIFSSKDARAQHLALVMDQSLVSDLDERGFHAVRLLPNAALPMDGWLVRGHFIGVDEGSRVKRAIIGFGTGHTSLEVRADVIDLNNAAEKQPLLDITTAAHSGKAPGALLGFNPLIAGAGFALAGLDSDTDVKNTAAKISDEIVKQLLPGEEAARSVSPVAQKIHDL